MARRVQKSTLPAAVAGAIPIRCGVSAQPKGMGVYSEELHASYLFVLQELYTCPMSFMQSNKAHSGLNLSHSLEAHPSSQPGSRSQLEAESASEAR